MRREGPTLVTSNPALMMTQDAPRHPARLPAGRRRANASRTTRRSSRVIAERYLDHDVRAVTGTTCWFTLLFEKVLEAARDRGRAAATVSDVWPNLRVLFGGGVAAAPYLPVIRDFIGRDDVTLVDTYNATEGGVYAASDFGRGPGLLMLPHRGTFFEFVPLEDARERRSPTARPSLGGRRGPPVHHRRDDRSGLYAYELGRHRPLPIVGPAADRVHGAALRVSVSSRRS